MFLYNVQLCTNEIKIEKFKVATETEKTYTLADSLWVSRVRKKDLYQVKNFEVWGIDKRECLKVLLERVNEEIANIEEKVNDFKHFKTEITEILKILSALGSKDN